MSATMTDKKISETELYPIRTVATLTGVNAITLRAWERRYGLIKPKRTAKGHRLYSREEIDLINHVVALIDSGVPISQVPIALQAEKAAGETEVGDIAEPWREYRERMLTAVLQFDEAELEDTYNEVLSLYPVHVATRRLLVPLLTELGERWQNTEGGIAEEHFFAVYMRNKLGARFHHRGRNNRGPRLLLACMPGEQHEIGLLLFALSAHDRGYQLIVMGADMPLPDLTVAARRIHSDAIVLSSSVNPGPSVLEEDLPRLVADTGLPVFVGGPVSVRHSDAIRQAGAVPLGDDVLQGMKRIGQLLEDANDA